MPCEILHPVVRGTSVNWLALILKTINLFVSCKLIFWKSYQSSPPKFPKLISQLWGIPQPLYFITLSLEAFWTYLWKHYIYYKKDTKVGSQNFGYQIWFCTCTGTVLCTGYTDNDHNDNISFLAQMNVRISALIPVYLKSCLFVDVTY